MRHALQGWRDFFNRNSSTNPLIMKIKIILGFAAVIMVLSGCGVQERKNMQAQIDSLNVEVKSNRENMATLQEVGVLLDSIDANRALLRVNMVEGMTLDTYSTRLKNINRYVIETESKIAQLEKSLKKANAGYQATIHRMKSELSNVNKQLAAMRVEGMDLKYRNGQLITQLSEKDSLLTDQQLYIKVKENELALKEAEAREMNEQRRVEKADLYFGHAAALETAADRTKFAPRKKKATRREALELYKISLGLGKTEAQERIDKLEKEIG